MSEREERSALRVLVAGRDPSLDRELTAAFARIPEMWISAETCTSCNAGIESLGSGAYDICLAAEPLTGASVLDFIRRAATCDCPTPILCIRDDEGQPACLDALEAGAVGVLTRSHLSAPLLECSIRHAIERRHLEEEIRTLIAAAGESARAKSKFLSTITHEFRTPLNAVIGLLDQVLDSTLSQDQHENLMFARFSAESLLALLTNVIECSSLEGGQVSLHNRFFRIRQLLAKIFMTFNLAAEQKSLHLSSHLGPGVPELLFGDPDRLTQIVSHLMDNAIKFTDQGEVALSVAVTDAHGPDLTLQWTISDTGPGIPSHQRDAVFHPFTQVDGSNSRRHGGAGVGLCIVRNLVSLLGGKIWVESGEVHGTRIHFTTRFSSGPGAGELPAGHGPQEGTSGLAPQPIKGKILAVDDSHVNRMVLADMLLKAGYGFMIVDGGLSALEALKKERFIAVLLDLQMPEPDGYETVKAIREREAREGGHLPVFALTANDDTKGRHRCWEAGFDGYLTKPLREHELTTLLRKYISPAANIVTVGTEPVPVPTGVDGKLLYSLLGRDSGAVAEIVDYFIREGMVQVQRIRAGLAARDEKTVEQGAHKLKGMATNVGATGIGDDAFRIQLAVRKGDFITPLEVIERVAQLLTAMSHGGEPGTDTDC